MHGPRPAEGGLATLNELLDNIGPRIDDTFSDWPDLQANMHFRLALNYRGLGRNVGAHRHFRRAHAIRLEALARRLEEIRTQHRAHGDHDDNERQFCD